MSEPDDRRDAGHGRPGSDRVRSTTRVNVAFPFSKVTVQEPSDDLVELTALVGDLAAVIARLAPGPEAERVRERALALARRMS